MVGRVGGGGVAVLPGSHNTSQVGAVGASLLQLQGRRGFPQLGGVLRYEQFGQEGRSPCRWFGHRAVFVDFQRLSWRRGRRVLGIVYWRGRRGWGLAVVVVWCWKVGVRMMSDVSVIFHLGVIAVIIRSVSHNLR